MTWEEFALKFLYDNGMTWDHAQDVVDRAFAEHELFEPLDGCWKISIDGYEEKTKRTFIFKLRLVAVEWLIEQFPWSPEWAKQYCRRTAQSMASFR